MITIGNFFISTDILILGSFLLLVIVFGLFQYKSSSGLPWKSFLLIVIGLLIPKFFNNINNKNTKEKIKEIDNKIDDVKKQIKEKDKEIEKEKLKLKEIEEDHKKIEPDLQNKLKQAENIKPKEIKKEDAENYIRKFINDTNNNK